jgi:hypothetical protein
VGTRCYNAILLAGLIASQSRPTLGAAADSIETQVRLAYPLTKFRPDRTQLLSEGTLFIVQRPGIVATSIVKGVHFVTGYKRGKLSHGFASSVGEMATESGSFQVNEAVYLFKIDVDTKKSTITMHVQSCGSCNPAAPDPDHLPERGAVKFDFEKGAFDTINFATVQGTIAGVFGGSVSAAPAPTVTSLVPPPGREVQAQAEAPPARIEVGHSRDQVKSVFGPPAEVISIGSKEIYLYPNLKVTFVDGKVSDVE